MSSKPPKPVVKKTKEHEQRHAVREMMTKARSGKRGPPKSEFRDELVKIKTL